MKRKKEFTVPGLTFMGYLRHHGFAVTESLKKIAAAPFATLLTLAVITFAIALPLFLWVVFNNIQAVTHSWESTQISIFLKKDTPEQNIQQLLAELRQHQQLAKVEFIPAARGLQEFEQRTGIKNVLAALQSNPLPDVITLYPTAEAQTPAAITALTEELKRRFEIETVQLDMDWVQHLYTLIKLVQQLVYALAIILGAGVLLIIINTIRTCSQAERSKIQVIKLIGGTHRFIRRPFLYMGLFYSLIGCGLAIAAVDYCLDLLNAPVQQIAKMYHIPMVLQGLSMPVMAAIIMGCALLGYGGAWLSLVYQLRQADNY